MTFPVEIARTDAGKPATLVASVQYGVCKEICIPAEAELSLALPAGELPAITGDVLADIPRDQGALRPGDPAIRRAVMLLDGAGPRIEIEVLFPSGTEAGAEAFLYAEGGVYMPAPALAKDLGGGLALFVAKLDGGVDVEAVKGRAITATIRGRDGASAAPVIASP